MEYRKSAFRLVLPALAVALASLVSTESSAKDLPQGIPVGPWILAPSFSSSYAYESNVFLEEEGLSSGSDRIGTLRGELLGSLPFRNSLLQLGYGASRESYDLHGFTLGLAQRGKVDLELNFRSGDTLALRDIYREDFARSRKIETGDDTDFEPVQVFEPEPYALNRWEVELSRDDPRRQGYLVRIRRQDFVYKGDAPIGFFDYRGFDNVFEYRRPLPSHRRWVLRYQTRRFDHFDSDCKTEPGTCDTAVGTVFRKELSDSIEFGLLGTLGEYQPYVVRMGYSSFRYEGGPDSSDFNGIVGYAAWRLVLGSSTDLQLRAARRALPSKDTYYINNTVRAQLTHDWRRFEGGAELEYDLNEYADLIPACGAVLRRDSTYELKLNWGWKVEEIFKFEISAFHTNRRSTCDTGDFEASGLETGIVLGW